MKLTLASGMKLLFLFFIQLLFIKSYSQLKFSSFTNPSNDPEIIKQNNITKEVIYDYNFNKNGIKDSTFAGELLYDDLGKVVQQRIGGNDKSTGDEITKYHYYYDTLGQLLKQISINEKFKLVSIIEYEYDSSGKEINNYRYNQDTTMLTFEHKVYDEKNRVKELHSKVNNGKYYLSRQYYYDSDNQLIKEEGFDEKNIIIFSTIYEFDKSLDKKSEYLQNMEGKKLKAEFFYNKDKQIIHSNSPDMYGKLVNGSVLTRELIVRRDYIYNSDKTLFETDVYLDGKKVQVNRHYYSKT